MSIRHLEPPLFVFKPSVSSESEDMIKFIYLCPACNKKYEIHCRGDVYDVRQLGCAKCRILMDYTVVEMPNANRKAKRVKGRK